MPKISVIVPVYNVEPYIHRCVDSILAQTFTDFELILVDDGSPDNCPAICDEYAEKDDRVHVIHQENGGLSAARNAGIDWAFANSDSEWISFIDSDDWICSLYLSELFKAVKIYDCDVSCCYCMDVDNECNDSIKDISSNSVKAKRVQVEEYCISDNSNAMIACAKLYKKKLFYSIRYPVGRLHEDAFVTYKVLYMHQSIAIVESKLYFYYRNPNGITRRAWTINRLDVLDALEEQIQYYKINNYKKAYNYAQRDLARRICICISLLERKKIDARIKQKLKNDLRKTIKSNIELFDESNDYWIFEKAWPFRTKIKWYSNLIKTRICNKC